MNNPITIEDRVLLLDALGSHLEIIDSFLSTCDDGDEVDSVREDRTATLELQARIKSWVSP